MKRVTLLGFRKIPPRSHPPEGVVVLLDPLREMGAWRNSTETQ